MAPPDPPVTGRRVEPLLHAATVLLGAVLIVVTAANQPYNQNEWQQIAPYDDPDLGEAVSGTRQPPLDALLGTLVLRLVGAGHLEQRLVPIACGIGSLVLTVLLLRRLDLGFAGVAATAFMAMSPVFLRISAYTRPYALPLTLMLLCAWAGTRWLDTGHRRWLAVVVVGAIGLPLSRVPEPTVFLGTAAALLAVAGLRDPERRARCWTLAAGLLVPLVTIGVWSSLTLARETQETSADTALLDLSPANALARTPAGLRELRDHVLPLHADWFPWWPVVLAAVVIGLLLRPSRRALLATWYWVPLALAPLVFLVAYHTVNAFPLEMRHYQIRFAYFWVPPLVLLIGAALAALARRRSAALRTTALVLAAALLVGQLPGTWRVMTENDAIDLAQAGQAVEQHVPPGAAVIYDSAARAGWWRQHFYARERFLDHDVRLLTAEKIAEGNVRIPRDAPVHLLLLDSACASSVACDTPSRQWSGTVDGYERVARVDRFTLYSPTEDQHGRSGAVRALRSLVAAFGVEWAVTDAAAAARLLEKRGRADKASALLRRVCAAHEGPEAADCRDELVDYGLGHLLDANAAG